MNRKAQIKMFETIAVLVVFFFLLLLGFVFYTRVQESAFESEMEEMVGLRAVDIAQKISFLPELQCLGEKCTEGEIDLLKLEPANKIISENAVDYFYIFGDSSVLIREVYPGDREWLVHDFSKEDAEVISTRIPVSLYDPIEDKHYFGVMYIDVYK